MAATRPLSSSQCKEMILLVHVRAYKVANLFWVGVLNTAVATATGQKDQKQETLTTIDLKRKREIYFSQNYNQWQRSWNVLFFSPSGCIGDRLPHPTPNRGGPNTMLRIINIVLWRGRKGGGGGACKIKYELLKSEDFVMELCSVQRAKYFCH